MFDLLDYLMLPCSCFQAHKAAGDSKDATLDIATESLVTFVCYSECKQLQLDLYTVSGTSATVKSLVPRNACHHFRLVSW